MSGSESGSVSGSESGVSVTVSGREAARVVVGLSRQAIEYDSARARCLRRRITAHRTIGRPNTLWQNGWWARAILQQDACCGHAEGNRAEQVSSGLHQLTFLLPRLPLQPAGCAHSRYRLGRLQALSIQARQATGTVDTGSAGYRHCTASCTPTVSPASLTTCGMVVPVRPCSLCSELLVFCPRGARQLHKQCCARGCAANRPTAPCCSNSSPSYSPGTHAIPASCSEAEDEVVIADAIPRVQGAPGEIMSVVIKGVAGPHGTPAHA